MSQFKSFDMTQYLTIPDFNTKTKFAGISLEQQPKFKVWLGMMGYYEGEVINDQHLETELIKGFKDQLEMKVMGYSTPAQKTGYEILCNLHAKAHLAFQAVKFECETWQLLHYAPSESELSKIKKKPIPEKVIATKIVGDSKQENLDLFGGAA